MRRRRVFFTKEGCWKLRPKIVISDDMEVKGAALSNGILHWHGETDPEHKSQKKLV